ncbi:iron ABC transporter ATP-binding protein [Methylobrevis albus]|uniref:ATP-binding cassette domain-containing protein n=1 Tax=Methylobrevis albus TaxID=2793297 RepID=A0A931MX86_9HYPH|nr:ATP-binding cassette domain-containing protein [Methylobrevis albus]MBH0236455.1 ATP-binding cassette domain-containing protein [Methylobrevis albus]
MIVVSNVSHRIGRAPILTDISLTLEKGGVTALIGPNGAGKSTLLSLIARLTPLQAGTITVDGLAVATTPGRTLARRLAVLPQDSAIDARLTVTELVGFGRFPHGAGRLTDADRAIVAASLQRFDLGDLAGRFIDTLSGGQRQRALVAMAHAQATDYLLLDEPLNNLDMQHARALMRTLRELADTERRTVLVVLHDINHAMAHADRVVALKDGRIAADGPPAAVAVPDVLERIFGYAMRVVDVDGDPVVLHHR